MNKNKIYDIGKVLALVAFGLAAKAITEDGLYSYCWLPLALAGAGVAASLIGKKKSKAPPPPKPVDIFAKAPIYGKGKNKKKIIGYKKSITEKQTKGVTDYYGQALPKFLDLEREFAPKFLSQAFDTAGQAYSGFAGLRDTAAAREAETIANLRAKELGTMTGQAGLTRGLMQALSPEQARSIELQQKAMERAQGLEGEFQAASKPYTGMFGTMAQEAFGRRGVLSPEEQRAAQQRARESATAAGRLGGNSAIAAEMLNREGAQAARRQEAANMAGLASTNLFQTEAQRAALRGEAQAAGQSIYGMAGEFYTTPGLNLLSRTPASYTAGSTMAGMGLDLGKSLGPQFDYNMPLGLAQQAGGAQNQYNQDVYNTNLANQQAKSQMWQGIGSSLLSAGLGSMGGASGSNFSSFLGGGNFGNAGTAFGNMGREAMGMPLRAYTV